MRCVCDCDCDRCQPYANSVAGMAMVSCGFGVWKLVCVCVYVVYNV